jgi:hypothetical protein
MFLLELIFQVRIKQKKRELMKGHLKKMPNKLEGQLAQYHLKLDEDLIPLNQYLGGKISINFLGVIHCDNCGKETKKSYNSGYCFKCVQTLARCDFCIVKPETCHFHKGTCREPEWGEKHCMIPHRVYLSNTSGVKVGITKAQNIPHRWIDQGAVSAIPIFSVSTRLQSGIFETLLGKEVADKTNWRAMLKGAPDPVDLEHERDRLFEICGEELDALEEEFGEDQVSFLEDEEIIEIEYPVLEYPEKVKSLGLEKNPKIEGTLLGIKGQYLILDNGVINIRNHGSYLVEVDLKK